MYNADLLEIRLSHVDFNTENVSHQGQLRRIQLKSCRQDETLFPLHKLLIPSLNDQLQIYTYHSWDYISNEISQNGYYEKNLMHFVKIIFDVDKSLQLLDIGCNLGPYSLLAMSFARKVVAVDPILSNLRRLLQSVCINNFSPYQLLSVWNAICSQSTGRTAILIHPNNIGGSGLNSSPSDTAFNVTADCIVLNDLLTLIPFTHAFMKIDIENAEHLAFLHADKLFSTIHIPIVLMEWSVKSYLPYTVVNSLLDFFYSRSYEAFMLTNRKLISLERQRHIEWPQNVIWIEKKYEFITEIGRMLQLAEEGENEKEKV